MPNKEITPLSLYGNDREYLREQDKTNELLADIAGVEYVSPGDPPKTGYMIEKRLLDAAQKKNELLDEIATGQGGGSASTLGINIDYATDVISLKKSGEPISGSGATLPAYGLNYASDTGGLTLTKNGAPMQGQTVALPKYGSPLTASSTSEMTDEDKVYVNTTDGKWYYYDGTAWTEGGTYNSQGIDTDTTLLVSGAPADAKATGDAVSELKTQIVDYNTFDVFGLYDVLSKYNGTSHGAHYSWDNGICTVTTDAGGTTDYSANILRITADFPESVKPGNQYNVRYHTTDERIQLRFWFKDASGTDLPSADPYRYFSSDGVLTIPENAAKWNIALRMLPGVEIDGSATVSEIKLITAQTADPNDIMYNSGMKYVAFGDSQTKGAVWSAVQGIAAHSVKPEWSIPTRIARALNKLSGYKNEGIGGIGYLYKINNQNIVDLVKSYDFSNVQLVTIMAGANDSRSQYTLGSSSSTADDGTICGAIQSIISHMKTNYPKVQLIFIQPLPFGVPSTTDADVWNVVTAGGWSLNQFNETVSELCRKNNIAYVDWMGCTYVNTWYKRNIGYNGNTGPYSHLIQDSDYCILGDFIAGRVSAAITSRDLEIDAIGKQLINHNAIDVFEYYNILTHTDGSNHGANFNWNGDICTVTTDEGGNTNTGINTLHDSSDLPDIVKPGDVLYVKYNTTDPRVRLRFLFRNSELEEIKPYIYVTEDTPIKVPVNAARWGIALSVSKNSEFDEPVTVSGIKMLSAMSNGELSEIITDQIHKSSYDYNDDPLSALYDNHFFKIPLIPAGPMITYKQEDTEIVEDKDVSMRGTDMIRCPKYIVFNAGDPENSERKNVLTDISTKREGETPKTMNGITFTLSDDGETYNINGMATSTAFVAVMMGSQNVLEANQCYLLDVESECSVSIRVCLVKTEGGNPDWNDAFAEFNGSGSFKIPATFYGAGIRMYVQQRTAYRNEKVKVRVWNSLAREESSPASARNIVMYFYKKVGDEYIRRDDVLKYVTSINKLNYFTNSILCNRVIEVPDNTYVQFGTDFVGDFAVYGWDGEHIGSEISGGTYMATAYNAGETTVLIPGTAKFLFSKSFAFHEVLGQPRGFTPYDPTQVPTDVVYAAYGETTAKRMSCALPDGYDYFVARMQKIIPLRPTTVYPTGQNGVYSGNLNDDIVAICRTNIEAAPVGRARRIIDAASAIAKIEWTCKKQIQGWRNSPSATSGYLFYKGVTYSGTPYTNKWLNPGALGFHISKHTFINAANDPRSIFYEEHSDYGTKSLGFGPGYGTVCSILCELCTGWPYPQPTGEYLKNPDNIFQMCENPIPGGFLYNNGGHCVIPELSFDADGIQAYTVYESVNPVAKREIRLSNMIDKGFRGKGSGEYRTYEYLHRYQYAMYRRDASGYADSKFYDIYSGQIINGSARPYRGDRSVMTNHTGVKINIHNESATKLYLQKCTYSGWTNVNEPVPYVIGWFTPVSGVSPISVDITGNQVEIDTSLLESGAFYGCYTDANSTMEYFEYRSVTPGTYQKTDDNFVFDTDPFWYVCFSRPDPNGPSVPGETYYVTIPYQSNGDYSRFRTAMNPADGMAASAFRKGTLGAYIVPLTAEI